MFNAMPDNWVARNGGSFGLLTWQAREALLGTGEVRVFSQQGTENDDFNLIFFAVDLPDVCALPLCCLQRGIRTFSFTHRTSRRTIQ